MRAERVGSDTVLAQIVKLVGEAQRTRAPIQRLADTVSAWFVPAVIFAAILTFLLWSLLGPEPKLAHGLVNAVAVLISVQRSPHSFENSAGPPASRQSEQQRQKT